MSQSPLDPNPDPDSIYFDAFTQLAERIRQGASFSGRERNCAFINLAGKSFADASAALGLDLEQDSRGIALSDWDHDGDVDIWMTNRTAPRVQFLRNEAATGSAGSVAFLLVGDVARRCPLDAAGARVVLSSGGIERVQTVHLGDGFLSQSSRWLQFGLGAEQQIDRVVVHWPAGGAESFEGARVGARLVLKQGAGTALPAAVVTPKQPGIKRLNLPVPSGAARVWLAEPAALPSGLQIPHLPEGPALLNLWASWCTPCLAELKSFGAAGDLPLVLLNIENADGEQAIDEERARAILRSAGIDQPAGFADAALIAELNGIVGGRIYRHRNLPLPASFLIDAQRRVRAIYKGRVEVDQAVADLRQLGDTQLDPLAAAVPIPGRWSKGLFKSHPIAVAATFTGGGYLDDARAYLVRSLANVGGADGAAELRMADVYMKLADLDREQGAFESAVSNYSRALAKNPALTPARVFLTLSLADLGRRDEAFKLVEELKRSAPGNPNFINLEADVYRALGDDARAVAAYRAVLAINRRYIPAIEAMTSILASSTDPEVRDGTAAAEMTNLLSQVPGMMNNPKLLNVAADALAANGDYGAALDRAGRALDLLIPYGDDESIREQRGRIARLENHGQPNADTATDASTD